MPHRFNLPQSLALVAMAWCVFLAFALLRIVRGPHFEPNNWRGTIALFVPVLITSVGVWAANRRRNAVLALALFLIFAFGVVTGFSIGVAYVPAVALLAWALISSVGSPQLAQ